MGIDDTGSRRGLLNKVQRVKTDQVGYKENVNILMRHGNINKVERKNKLWEIFAMYIKLFRQIKKYIFMCSIY